LCWSWCLRLYFDSLLSNKTSHMGSSGLPDLTHLMKLTHDSALRASNGARPDWHSASWYETPGKIIDNACDQKPYLHNETKGGICIKIEFNPQNNISLLQHGCRFFVLLLQHGLFDVIWTHSIDYTFVTHILWNDSSFLIWWVHLCRQSDSVMVSHRKSNPPHPLIQL